MSLDPALIQRIRGFGQPVGADAYVFSPRTREEILELYELARKTGRSVSFAGSRRSYGSPMMTPEGIVISLANFRSIGPIENGAIQVGGGVTIDQLWRATAPQGFWPRVVSGTSSVTIAGAIAMNIHGKNAYKVGNIGDNVRHVEVVSPSGADCPGVGSMGLLGAITSATLELHPIESASVNVVARSPRSLEGHLTLFDEMEGGSDYMVSWVDMKDRQGRGVFHAATYATNGEPLDSPQLPGSKLFGLVPRSEAWRFIRLASHPSSVRLINALKFRSTQWLDSRKTQTQSLSDFNFLLDALPGWERAFPRGLTQFQVFAPRDSAEQTFRELIVRLNQSGIPCTLGVLKKHRSSEQILPYAVDGFSLALDLPWHAETETFCRSMADDAIDQGCRFYLAKDSTLTASQYQRSLPAGALGLFQKLKQTHDPDGILQSIQSRHLGLT